MKINIFKIKRGIQILISIMLLFYFSELVFACQSGEHNSFTKCLSSTSMQYFFDNQNRLDCCENLSCGTNGFGRGGCFEPDDNPTSCWALGHTWFYSPGYCCGDDENEINCILPPAEKLEGQDVIQRGMVCLETARFFFNKNTVALSGLTEYNRDSGKNCVAIGQNNDETEYPNGYDFRFVQNSLPLSYWCKTYKIISRGPTQGEDWPSAGTSIPLVLDTPTQKVFGWSSFQNTFEARLSTNDCNRLNNIVVYFQDSSPNNGGMTYDIICDEKFDDLDQNKNTCICEKGGDTYWNDEVNNTNFGQACCGDDEEDIGKQFGNNYCTITGWNQFSGAEGICEENGGDWQDWLLQYNYTAKDGIDGCCGDDVYFKAKLEKELLNITYKGFVIFRANNINLSSDVCRAFTNCKKTKTTYYNDNQSYINVSVETRTDGNNSCNYCVKSGTIILCYNLNCTVENGDLGYFTPNNQYLCNYWNSVWRWNNAQTSVTYQITKIDDLGIDAISNGANWSYCDAAGQHLLGVFGNRNIPNFGTFPDSLEEGQCLCPNTPSNFILLPESECTSEYARSLSPCCGVSNPETYNSDRPEYSCYDSPYFPPSQGGCMKCFDSEGREYPSGGQSSQENDYIDKELWFGFGGSYGWSPNLNCSQNNGFICGVDETCKNGFFIRVSDSDRCCWSPDSHSNNLPYCEQFLNTTMINCLDINPNNIIVTSVDIQNGFRCNNFVDSIDTDRNITFCCSDGYWWNISAFPTSNQNNSFICYLENNQNLFGECCYGRECNNLINPLIISLNEFDNGNLFTTGSPLHSIETFNTYLTGIVRDLIFKANLGINNYVDIYKFKNTNWSQYDTLEFDLGYYTSTGTTNINNISFFSGQNLIFTDDIWNYTIFREVQGQSNIWHHIIINLTPIPNKNNITRIRINYNNSPGSFLYLDNFALYSLNTQLDKRYCTGAFHKWIENLNPTNYDANNFLSYGPYWYACDAQMSFKWTGTKCCGSKTKVSIYEKDKEFYVDNWSGCFAGITVLNDQTVGDAYNNAGYIQNIMFYNKNFYECGNFSSHGVQEPLGLGNITTISKNYFDVVGSKYCDVDGKWKKIDRGTFTKILAAKLYNLTNKIESSRKDYSLYCDSAENAVNAVWDDIEKGNFCVLNMRKSGGENGPRQIIIGTTANIEELLNAINSTHPPFSQTSQMYNYQITNEMINNCKYINTENATSFFVKCLDGSNYDNLPLYVYYNNKFKLVLFSQEPITGLEPSTGFFSMIWNFFKKLFCFLFQSCEKSTGRNIIPLTVEEADFEKLYLAKKDELFIKGLEETNRNAGYSGSIEFHNFTTNLKFLTDGNIIKTRTKKYILGENKQIITYTFSEDNYDTEIFRKLTSGLRIKSISGDKISDKLGNGYAGWDEECDCLVNTTNRENNTPIGFAPGPQQPAHIICRDDEIGSDFKGLRCDIQDGFLSCNNGIIDYSNCRNNTYNSDMYV
ncbi:MAG: hypothetical protein QXG00_00645 [Candidatus Woesearchaeota archaeon]